MTLDEFMNADVMTLDDFMEELDIAIKQDGHDIYLKADSAKLIKNTIQMAIDAVKQSTSDLISRQAAIDGVKTLRDVAWKNWHEPTLSANVVLDMIGELPSVQTEPIRINLNEPIKVKLTDWGKEIYYHQYDRTNQIAGREICKPRFPREDENGYTKFQLWCFMELYGTHMGMTLPNVIEPLEVVYER